jgi:hypothetical protein
LPTTAPSPSLGPFRGAELIKITESGCSAPPCYLALTDAHGMWLVHEVTACSGAEGMSASLNTLSLRVIDHKLVWKYEHHVRMDEATTDRVTVECSAGVSGPECTTSGE